MKLQIGIILTALAVAHALPISEAEIRKKSSDGLRLIDLAADAEPVWMTEDEKLELIRNDVGFFDVTEVYDPNTPLPQRNSFAVAASYPPPSRQTAVKPILTTVSIANMQSYLATLTAFNNRYYKSATGAAASDWIVKTVGDIAKLYPASGATAALYTHSFVQSSIVAKIPGTTSGPVTILGAHMDSINSGSPTSGRAPGADDDGSGTVNLIEAFRALLASGFKPRTPVEFHWYAGEEGGLLGSQAIANAYKGAGTQVKAMLQLDMTAYVRPGSTEVIALIPDNTDAGLNTFLGQLITAYSRLPWVTSPGCGYGCSDHASWYKQGYPTAMPFETPFGQHNPAIHSSSDTVTATGFSWNHTLEYAKLAVAFAYELGI